MQKTQCTKFGLTFGLAMVLALFLAAAAIAAEIPRARVTDPGQARLVVALATPTGNSSNATNFSSQIRRNLDIVPFFEVISGNSIPGGGIVSASGENIDFRAFSLVGARLLVAANWADADTVEMRVYDVTSGMYLTGNRYNASGNLENMADAFSDDLVQVITGKSTLFRSTLAFVKSGGKGKKDLWTVKVNGNKLSQLTNMQGESLSPTWAYDNSRIAFSHIAPRSHGLGLWTFGSKTFQRIKYKGTFISPCFLPDGRLIASMTDGTYPSIFSLSATYQKSNRIEGSSGIDVSPSVDASGSKMVFTSSRFGNPQVFLRDLRTGGIYRVSQGGAYNSDPSINADGTAVVYARMMPGGHKLFVSDLVNNTERQITFGGGSDESPEFSSDGYFIAFMSNKNGRRQLFLTTRDGATPKLIPTGSGDALMPAWSHVR